MRGDFATRTTGLTPLLASVVFGEESPSFCPDPTFTEGEGPRRTAPRLSVAEFGMERASAGLFLHAGSHGGSPARGRGWASRFMAS